MTGGWTPRPPRADEPACWSWPVPPIPDRDEEIARLTIENETLPVDERRDPRAFRYALYDMAVYRFNRFHDGRCAVCATPSGPLVLDHCHSTGQWRGWCCRGCNTAEGRSGANVFIRYRRIHPAAILDLHEMYTGMAWTDGWSWHTSGAAALTRGRRPATPWPVWSPDANPEDDHPV